MDNNVKKTGTEQHIPRIKEGFTKTMKEKYGVSEEKSEELIVNFIKVIEDASDYLFSLNHSEAYSYIGYVCGYLRYYYPLEFITVALNIYENDMEKTAKIVEYAKERGIEVRNPAFGYSKAEYFMDKSTNSIYKGVKSIKYLNKVVGDFLYSLKDKHYETFSDLLVDIVGILNSRQILILIKLDFFKEFGKTRKILNTYIRFNDIYGRKNISKTKFPQFNNIFSIYAEKETEKQFKIKDSLTVLRAIEEREPNIEIPIEKRIACWLENVGVCTLKDRSRAGEFVVLDVNQKYTPKVMLYSIGTGVTQEVKVYKKVWKHNTLERLDVIRMTDYERKFKQKKVEGQWVKSDETELVMLEYFKISEE